MYLIQKEKECIGHVKKRVGRALRKLQRENPGLGGKGKLTDGKIGELQNYYGIAFLSMWGIWREWIKPSTPVLCTVLAVSTAYFTTIALGSTSRCMYQQDEANKTRLYKHGPGLRLPVIAKLKPEYARLKNGSLLEKCLHRKSQYQNEALNCMVWQRTLRR